MKINSFLFGLLSLEHGVKFIGVVDVITLIVDVVFGFMAASARRAENFFPLPVNSSLVWAIIVKILLCDLIRVMAFALLVIRSE